MLNAQKTSNAFTTSVEISKGKSTHTFIFIHDLGFDKRMWFPAIKNLGNDYRLIAYDIDGFGTNTKNNLAAHTLEKHVADLNSLIKKRRINNPVLIGVGFGAYIAMHTMYQSADAIKGLMISTALPYAPNREEYTATIERINMARAKDADTYVDSVVSALNIDGNNIQQIKAHMGASNMPNIASALVASLTRPDIFHALTEYDAPLFILLGQDTGEKTKRAYLNISLNMPNTTLIRIPESTSLIPLENPAAFQSALLRFVKLIESK